MPGHGQGAGGRVRKSGIGKMMRNARRCLQAAVQGLAGPAVARPLIQSLEGRLLLAASDPVINEFLADNNTGLVDQFSNHEDWIEIYNPGTAQVDLGGWHLSDERDNPTKWTFPSPTYLNGGQYLVVFASNNDIRTGSELHTNFKLDADGEYLALFKPDGTATTLFDKYPPQARDISYGLVEASSTTVLKQGDPVKAYIPPNAALPDYTGLSADETGWTPGTSGVGYDDNPDYMPYIGLNMKTMPRFDTTASVLIRAPFTIDDPAAVNGLKLRMKYEDGFVAYLNGTRVASDNAPATLAWNSRTLNGVNRNPETLAVNWTEFDLSGYLGDLRQGTNILAIHGLNSSTGSSDMLLLPELDVVKLDSAGRQAAYLRTPTPWGKNISAALNLGPLLTDVTHTPQQPADADNIVVTARVAPWQTPIGSVTLKYRVNYGSETSLAMRDDGASGDGVAGDGVYGATIPASASTPGQMVRWYVVAADAQGQSSRAPLFATPTGAAQYYGTVIANPVVTSNLPILQWFVESPSAANTDAGTSGSLYYRGRFYDNVIVQLRGGSSRSWPKVNYKVHFNPGENFRYADDAPAVNEINLNSTYSDKTFMRQVLSWETYRDAGVSYCYTYPLRIQQNGQFFSVAILVEEPDDDYLERNGYNPDGSLYKLTSDVPGTNFQANPFEKKNGPADRSDLNTLVNDIRYSQTLTGTMRTDWLAQYMFEHFDVPQMIEQWAVNTLIHDNDDAQKNYYLYIDNQGDGLWRMLPWDKDLVFGRNFNGSAVLNDTIWADYDGFKTGRTGTSPSHPLFGTQGRGKIDGAQAYNAVIDALLAVPAIKEMYLRRLRDLMDQFLQPPGTSTGLYYETRIDQLYNLMKDDVALDKAKWSQYGTPQDLLTAVNALKNQYLAVRRSHLYVDHSTNTSYPDFAGIPGAHPANALINFGTFEVNPASANQLEEYIELKNPNAFAVDISGWRLSGGVEFKFAPGTVIAANGSLYVSPDVKAFRNRANGPKGGMGLFVVGPYKQQLSTRGETVVLRDLAGQQVNALTYAGNPSAVQQHLRITEVMYNPAAPAAGSPYGKEEFEFVELQNTSSSLTLNLHGVKFTQGVDYQFSDPSGNIPLGPGQYVVVVKNPAAFAARYPGADPAGVFGPYVAKYLNNGGDRIQLLDAVNEEVHDFRFEQQWHPASDGLGRSLVIQNVAAAPDLWGTDEAWRPSTQMHGSPLAADPDPAGGDPTVHFVNVWPNPRSSPVDSITIVFSEPIRDFELADLTLTRDAGANLLGGTQTLSTTDGQTWTLANLAGLTRLKGTYVLTLDAAHSGITDTASNPLFAGDADTFVMSVDALAASISPAIPDPRSSAVYSLIITFNAAVSGFDLADLKLTRDGAAVPWGAQTLTSSDGLVWTLGGLGTLTNLSGNYLLRLEAANSGIVGLAGNPLLDSATESFTVDLTPPQADIVDVTPDPRSGPVDSIIIAFSEAVGGFDRADLTLSRDGSANLLTAAQSLTPIDATHWRLENLAGLTDKVGLYVLSLKASGSGIYDLLGNGLAADASDVFVMDAINGDITPGAADIIRLLRDPADSTRTLVFRNDGPTPEYSFARNALARLFIDPLDGDDQITLDYANGSPLPDGGAALDGGSGADSLRILGTAGADVITAQPGQISFGSALLTHAGLESIHLETGSGDDTLNLSGNLNPAVRFIGGTGSDKLFLSGGTFTFNSDLGLDTTNLILNVDTGSIRFNSSQRLGGLSIGTQGLAMLGAQGGRVLALGNLAMAGGTLDLNDNRMIVRSTRLLRQTVLASLTGWIKSGRNGELWNGSGLISTSAAQQPERLTGLGVLLNDSGAGRVMYSTFAGQTVGVNDLLVSYTFNGDADLNGRIDASDYFRMNRGQLRGLSAWRDGNFDYLDGVDGADYALIDRAFLAQGASPLLQQPSAARATFNAKRLIAAPARPKKKTPAPARLHSRKPGR